MKIKTYCQVKIWIWKLKKKPRYQTIFSVVMVNFDPRYFEFWEKSIFFISLKTIYFLISFYLLKIVTIKNWRHFIKAIPFGGYFVLTYFLWFGFFLGKIVFIIIAFNLIVVDVVFKIDFMIEICQEMIRQQTYFYNKGFFFFSMKKNCIWKPSHKIKMWHLNSGIACIPKENVLSLLCRLPFFILCLLFGVAYFFSLFIIIVFFFSYSYFI